MTDLEQDQRFRKALGETAAEIMKHLPAGAAFFGAFEYEGRRTFVGNVEAGTGLAMLELACDHVREHIEESTREGGEDHRHNTATRKET